MDKKQHVLRQLPPRRLLAHAISAALASGVGLAVAADAPRQLNTVVVEETAVPVLSSPKQTATLLDNPQTVTVIPQAVYKAQGAQSLFDVLKNTPGISFDGGENGFAGSSNNFSMRGFDASSSIFIDGARDSGSYSRDIFNLEQVEVAKGPAADNGRGGAGGYVNLVTKSPKLENFVAGSVSYGFDEYDSKDRRRTTADINQKIGNNAAVRLNLLVSDGGKAGREEVELNTLGVAPSIAFGLGTDTRTILSYQRTEQNDIPDFGVPTISIKGAGSVPNANAYSAAFKDVDRDNFYGSTSDYDDTTSDAVLFRIEHDLSQKTTLSNQTRYAEVERRALFTVNGNVNTGTGQVARSRLGYGRDNTSLSNQTNLSTHFTVGSVKNTLAAGVELSHEKSTGYRYGGASLGSPTATNVRDPDSSATAGSLRRGLDGSSDIKIDTLAAYAYNTAELSERWQVTGGLRAERYKVSIDSNRPLPGGLSVSGSETTLGGKLGLVFKPAKNGSIYASFASSSQPPGTFLSNSDISRTTTTAADNGLPGLEGVNNLDSKPQVSLNLELGTKWSLFQERLLATAALFHTEKREIAITGRDTLAGGAMDPIVLKGYGKQIVQGIELGATGKLTDAWSVFGGVVLLESERKHSAALDRARCNANSGDYGGGPLPAAVCGVTGTDGDELAFTPKVSANLWTTYRATEALTLGLGAQHVGKQIAGRPSDAERIVINGKFGDLPSYTVINALASYAVNKNLSVRLNVDNILDKKYAQTANWGVTRADLGSPRAFLVSADFKF